MPIHQKGKTVVSEGRMFRHGKLAAKRDFQVPEGIDLSQLSDAELVLVKDHGYWMEALEQKMLAPTTDAQRHFLQVCFGAEKPSTVHEIAWRKYKDAILRLRAVKHENLQRDDAEASRRKHRIEVGRQEARSGGVSEADNARRAKLVKEAHLNQEGRLDEWWKSKGSQLSVQELEGLASRDSQANPPLKAYVHRKLELIRPPQERQWKICPNCGGDGGAKRECYKCGGGGWI